VPDAGPHAPILIAAELAGTQRLNRDDQADARVCNSTVVIFFAGVYLEANLNYIAETLAPKHSLRDFCRQPNPSLEAKLGWFYNEFIARTARQPHTGSTCAGPLHLATNYIVASRSGGVLRFRKLDWDLHAVRKPCRKY
jgi:hypothetical protein